MREWVGVLEIAPNPYWVSIWVSRLIISVIKKSNAQVITGVGVVLAFFFMRTIGVGSSQHFREPTVFFFNI
jgi:hypothetical protein